MLPLPNNTDSQIVVAQPKVLAAAAAVDQEEQFLALLGASDTSALVSRAKTDAQITEFMAKTDLIIKSAQEDNRKLRHQLALAEGMSKELVVAHKTESCKKDQRIAELEKVLADAHKQVAEVNRLRAADTVAAAAQRAQAVQEATQAAQNATAAQVAAAVQAGNARVQAEKTAGDARVARAEQAGNARATRAEEQLNQAVIKSRQDMQGFHDTLRATKVFIATMIEEEMKNYKQVNNMTRPGSQTVGFTDHQNTFITIGLADLVRRVNK